MGKSNESGMLFGATVNAARWGASAVQAMASICCLQLLPRHLPHQLNSTAAASPIDWFHCLRQCGVLLHVCEQPGYRSQLSALLRG